MKGLLKALRNLIILVLVIGILFTTSFIGVYTAEYVTRQNFNFRTAFEWSIKDLTEIIEKEVISRFRKSDVIEYPLINRYIDIMPCVNLKLQ